MSRAACQRRAFLPWPGFVAWAVALTMSSGPAAFGGGGEDETPVIVIVDMNAVAPGIQSSISVPAGTDIVRDVAVYIFDPLGQRSVWSLGFLGGIDRGLGFGHTPAPDEHQGSVSGMRGRVGTPVNPFNVGWLEPYLDEAFAGPEVQYLEFGAMGPATIGAAPTAPIFRVDIELTGAQAGDRFGFYLVDFVTVWSGGSNGVFSTTGPFLPLDTGGDAVPDGTNTLWGIDPDPAIPVPPAAYLVDYIDGPPGGGPAVIEVVANSDVNGDGVVDVLDLIAVVLGWGPCPPGCPADATGDGVVDVLDLIAVIEGWGPAPFSEQHLCEMTDGTWDPLSCGHYFCGQFPDCDAIIPGCDCGPGRNFQAGLGCVPDPACGEE